MQIKKIILVFKTHFDIGFTRLSREILDFYSGEMLDRVKETCDATRDMGSLRYVWTMPAWPLKIMRERSTEQRAAMLDDLIERGQLTWHALPYTSHYDFLGVEDAVQGLRYEKELSERYGQPLRCAAKMTDVPGYGRFLPELLADAGVRFLHLGCNEFATPPQVPKIFWWEAPSGKRVLTMYNSGYGTDVLPSEDWPFSTWMALMNTHDNCGPQTAEIVSSVYEEIHAHYPEAEIVCGTLEDVWNALSEEDLSGLPVVDKDLADTWIHGAASYPRESGMVRRLRGRLARVGRALAMSDGADAEAIRHDVNAAYDDMALFAEHTWGLDVKTWLGEIPDYEHFEEYRRESEACARMEESWREQTERAEAAQAACARAERALGLDGPKVFEFSNGCRLHGEQSLAGARYRLDFSADTGVIHALYDQKLGCRLLSERDGTGVFSYRYDRFGADDLTEYLRSYAHRFSDWGILDNGRAGYPECGHVTRRPAFEFCEQSGRTLRFVYRAAEGQRIGDAEHICIYVTMPEDDRPVRVRIELSGKQASPYVESGALCVPLAAEHPAYYVNKTGSVLRPETDIARGANHAFYALEHFAAAEDERSLVSVVSHDCPLLSIGENGVHQFRMDYEEHAPEFRFCLFNNMWGTNFPQWIEGDMAFEFDVFADMPGGVGAAYMRACELAENPDGSEAVQTPFALSQGLYATSLTREGSALLLHVHSCEGTLMPAEIRGEGWRFTEVDLLGRALGCEWENVVETEFQPYALRTFRAEKMN